MCVAADAWQTTASVTSILLFFRPHSNNGLLRLSPVLYRRGVGQARATHPSVALGDIPRTNRASTQVIARYHLPTTPWTTRKKKWHACLSESAHLACDVCARANSIPSSAGRCHPSTSASDSVVVCTEDFLSPPFSLHVLVPQSTDCAGIS